MIYALIELLLLFRSILALSMMIFGETVEMYINSEKINSFTISRDFKPVKFNMKTQEDRSSIEYLNMETRFFLQYSFRLTFPLNRFQYGTSKWNDGIQVF